jgi:site-specific recombinase XerD
MLKVLYYASLRASEICALDDQDIDLKELTIRVREGKGGRDGLCFLSEDAAATLRQYLALRPPLKVDGRQPLFYTDFSGRWDRRDIYRLVIHYKEKAGITKPGGAHVFARHTPATIAITRGTPLNVVQQLLRHKNIQITCQYCHIDEAQAREAHRKGISLS